MGQEAEDITFAIMNIGFDAKRAYHNSTGLGHFSRTLIKLLRDHFPMHQYFLFNPKSTSEYRITGENIYEVLPGGMLNKLFSSAWRSSWVTKDLKKYKIDLYHGLSHEIPVGISKTEIKSVVTIHDLIHEKHPEQYNAIDVKIYHKKFLYACRNADKIMAISQETKKDIVELYGIEESKVVVCYQSCDPVFAVLRSGEEKLAARKKYGLPENFFLHVGSVIERKNLLNICKALFIVRNDLDIPLVIIGDGGKYKQLVKDYIKQQGLEKKIIFLTEKENRARTFIPLEDLPTLYQCATAMIYPSFFEGFGAPVLEALWSGLPVITSNTSCLPEVGGHGAYYVDPNSAEEIANGMLRLSTNPELVVELKQKGWEHVQNFTPEKYVRSVMDLYESL
jgi:glycosyltransferase involved in cell wall biosynthesis